MLLNLLVATGVLLASLLTYSMATALTVHVAVVLIRTGSTGPRFWKNVLAMMILSLITAATHLVQIALWALAYFLCGAMQTFETAFYFSAESYTTLGYGDIVLPERWRLLGPLEAVNGLLLIGLSTALMFAVMSDLIANRLGAQPGPWSEAARANGFRSSEAFLSGYQGYAR